MTLAPYDELRQRLTRTLAGRYAVAELLGAGGMAAVFRAQDLALERTVAIKVLPPDLSNDDHLVSRFQQEAKIAAKLDHPNIIPIYRVESESGLNYFVMKFVAGRSLDDLLAPGRPIDAGVTIRVLTEAAAALGHAHQRGVVHRDVKPANIMLEADTRVILTDFGISKAIESASGLTRTGIIVGTPHYMAPEQAMGLPVDGRADQYALACVGYHMLTGELPFPGDIAHSVLHRHIYEDVDPIATRRPDVPRAMAAALERALAKEPADRFGSMAEFSAAVEGAVDVGAPSTRVRTPRTGARPRAIAPTVSLEGPTAPMHSSATREYQRHVARDRRWRIARWAGALAVVAAAGVALARPRGPDEAAPTRPPPALAAMDSAVAHRDSAAGTSVPAADSALLPAGGSRALDNAAAAPAPLPPPPAPVVIAAKPAAPKTNAHTRAQTETFAHRTAPRPKPKPRPLPPAAASEPASATLTIEADPYGTVYLDGRKLGDTPIDGYLLQVGRSYEVTVEREGYKTKRETIRVIRPDDVRRRYVLEPTQP